MSQKPPKRNPDSLVADKQLPCDLQAEIGVLGSVILMPDCLDEIAATIKATDFYDDAHRMIYESMSALHESGKKIDDILLVSHLKNVGNYDAIGGPSYLSKVINAVPNAAHVAHYAEIVRNKSLLRAMIYAGTEMLRDAYDDEEPTALLSRSEQALSQIAERRIEAGQSREFSAVVLDAIEALDGKSKGPPGLATGFAGVDRVIGGLKPGTLTIIGGRPSMGKTAAATSIAAHVADSGSVPVLFVSLEMTAMEIANRLIVMRTRIYSDRICNRHLTEDERRRIVDASGSLGQLPIHIDDHPSRSVTEIAAMARRQKRKRGLALVVIDYLQLIEPDNPRDPREQQVAKIARRLKQLARELQVPVLCLAQLNRETERASDKRPRLSHLRESGSIEQDADVVIFTHRPAYYTSNTPTPQGQAEEAEFIVAKVRNGRQSTVNVLWFGSFICFNDKASDPQDYREQQADDAADDKYPEFQRFNKRTRERF